ncbi:MAG: DnaB-like helicase C-terminal domain-containing protein [Dehalococcoidales bacterium]|nr:DnaB-like helicase C-terminal domain-containing protein [Dehalococcoidales bacterium]
MLTENKLPPHNIDAEDNVIGSLLIDGDLIHGLNLEPSDFYHEINQFIFSACIALAERAVSINQITLAQELNEKGKLEAAGGAAYLSHLIASCATSLDCRYYADIVKRLATYRGLIAASDKIATLGYGQGPDISDSLNKADEILLALRKNGAASPIITPKERASLMADRYSTLFTAEAGIALPTGLPDLDAQIGGGLYAGEMAIVAARPGLGKTTFLMNVGNNRAASHKVLVCSAEMTVAGITDRDVASVLGMTTNEVRSGGYVETTFAKILGEGLSAVIDRQLYFYHETPLTTDKILQAGVNMQLRHGLDLIVVDYLGLLDDDYGNSQYERTGYVSRKLKQIAMKLDVPILVAHQLNRALETRPDKRPMLYDLRDSGRIEEDADLVLFLYRDSYYQDDADDVTEILIAKQRQGEGHKIVKVFYDRQHQQYRDLVKGGEK